MDGYQVLQSMCALNNPLLGGRFSHVLILAPFCLGSTRASQSLRIHPPSHSSFFHDRPHPILSSARISYLRLGTLTCATPSFIMHPQLDHSTTISVPPLPFHSIPFHSILSSNTTLSSHTTPTPAPSQSPPDLSPSHHTQTAT